MYNPFFQANCKNIAYGKLTSKKKNKRINFDFDLRVEFLNQVNIHIENFKQAIVINSKLKTFDFNSTVSIDEFSVADDQIKNFTGYLGLVDLSLTDYDSARQFISGLDDMQSDDNASTSALNKKLLNVFKYNDNHALGFSIAVKKGKDKLLSNINFDGELIVDTLSKKTELLRIMDFIVVDGKLTLDKPKVAIDQQEQYFKLEAGRLLSHVRLVNGDLFFNDQLLYFND